MRETGALRYRRGHSDIDVGQRDRALGYRRGAERWALRYRQGHSYIDVGHSI